MRHMPTLAWLPGSGKPQDSSQLSAGLQLENGARVGVVGGGPAGSFFSFFLLQMAQWVNLDLALDIYEPRDFSQPGPQGCNMCGGIISESLVQNLAAEGIVLPQAVMQRGIDSYVLHMDVGTARIETPLREKRIAAVHRAVGPRGVKMVAPRSFDGFLLDLAKESGARVIRARVDGVAIEKGRPKIKARNEWHDYDLLAVAIGINSTTSKLFEQLGVGYKTPRGTKAYVCEYLLGTEMIDRYLGSSMHVFLLDLPGLDFAAIIPKGEYVTVCVLGHNVNQELVDTFLHAPEVRECLPPQWQPPTDYCRCSPKLNVQHRTGMFADRIVFLGDCGVTRLYKDGIGAAYGTAKAAALTAILDGIAAEDFRRHYWPVCCRLGRDNQIGKLIFAVTRQIAKHRRLRRAVWRMTLREQRQIGPCPMSQTLWDTFTGSAPYRHVFRRSFDPRFWAPLILEILRPTGRDPQRRPIC